MSFKYPLKVFLDILETRFETLPFLLTNTSQIITAKNGVVAINRMIPAALMKAPYLSVSPPEPQCCSCAFFFFFFFVVVVVVDGFFIPLFFRLFGVGDGDFSTNFFPLPFCYDSTNAPHEWMYQQQPSCVVVVVVVVMVVVVRSDDFD